MGHALWCDVHWCFTPQLQCKTWRYQPMANNSTPTSIDCNINGAADSMTSIPVLNMFPLEFVTAKMQFPSGNTARSVVWDRFITNRELSQYPKRRLIVRSREVSKPRDLYLKLSDRFKNWQALRRHCCRCTCQISKRYDDLKANLVASRLHEILR